MGKKSRKARKRLIIKLSIWLVVIVLIVTAVLIGLDVVRDAKGCTEVTIALPQGADYDSIKNLLNEKELKIVRDTQNAGGGTDVTLSVASGSDLTTITGFLTENGIDIAQNSKGIYGDGSFVTVNIPENSDLDAVTNILSKNGFVKYKFAFKLYAGRRDTSGGFNSGDVVLTKGMSYAQLCNAVIYTKKAEYITIRFNEGAEVSDIIQTFVENGIGTEAGFKEALATYDFNYDFIPAAGTENRLEGYLFPDTYQFYDTVGERKALQKLVDTFYKKIRSDELNAAIAKSGMSYHDIIVLASIIEKEAGSEADMPLISSVFHNRIKKAMKLQSCATFNYTLPKADRKSALNAAQIATDTPYNTYMYEGLPPTPISNPGYAAILAAVQPADTAYLYFCSKGDGTSAFAKTYSEHEANVNKYKENW